MSGLDGLGWPTNDDRERTGGDCPSATCSPSDYDAGLLSDYGGGDVNWWQDYLRAEIGRANDYWREIYNAESDESEMQRICVRGMRVKNTQLANTNERMKIGLLSIRDRVRNSQTQTEPLMKIGMIVEISLENNQADRPQGSV